MNDLTEIIHRLRLQCEWAIEEGRLLELEPEHLLALIEAVEEQASKCRV